MVGKMKKKQRFSSGLRPEFSLYKQLLTITDKDKSVNLWSFKNRSKKALFFLTALSLKP